jgi:putative copper export protein
MSSLLLVASGHASAATPTSVEIGNVAALIWAAVWVGGKTFIADFFLWNCF